MAQDLSELFGRNSLLSSPHLKNSSGNPLVSTEINEAQKEEEALKNDLREMIREEHPHLLGKRGNLQIREQLSNIILREINKRLTGNVSIELKNNKSKIVASLINDLSGFGPLDPLLSEPGVSEIQVNGPGKGKIRVEQNRRREWIQNLYFEDKAHLLRVVEQILIPINRRFDALHPFVDAWLPDGSRVNAVWDNVGVDGPYISIRRFLKAFTIQELLKMDPAPITAQAADFLKRCIECDLGVLIGGGTGAGKTTWLNALSGFIPHSQSIVTGEDSLEIQLQHPDVRRHITVPANAQGEGAVNMQAIVKNMLRQFPDFIVIGETRGDEAWDITEAGNTGHVVMTTVHANSAADTVPRYANLIYSAKPIQERAIQDKIRRAFQIIVYAYRDKKTGIRAIKEIAQLGPLVNGEVQVIPLFSRKNNSLPLEYTGEPFIFADTFEAQGIAVPDYMNSAPILTA
jgi:pilus assembly protein CpaF